nr:MAG TPA: hypothetical protein [Caudoviricetes sp.]
MKLKNFRNGLNKSLKNCDKIRDLNNMKYFVC